MRRTLFNTAQRTDYMTRLLFFVNEVFRTSHGLSDPDSYHQFCRLLARLKTNFQLSELIKIEGFEDCMQRLAIFTAHSLRHWLWAANSIHYLLAVWERMASSIPCVTTDRPRHVDKYCPQIIEAYIQVAQGRAEKRCRGIRLILSGKIIFRIPHFPRPTCCSFFKKNFLLFSFSPSLFFYFNYF